MSLHSTFLKHSFPRLKLLARTTLGWLPDPATVTSKMAATPDRLATSSKRLAVAATTSKQSATRLGRSRQESKPSSALPKAMWNLTIYERAGKKSVANFWWQVWQHVLNILPENFFAAMSLGGAWNTPSGQSITKGPNIVNSWICISITVSQLLVKLMSNSVGVSHVIVIDKASLWQS